MLRQTPTNWRTGCLQRWKWRRQQTHSKAGRPRSLTLTQYLWMPMLFVGASRYLLNPHSLYESNCTSAMITNAGLLTGNPGWLIRCTDQSTSIRSSIPGYIKPRSLIKSIQTDCGAHQNPIQWVMLVLLAGLKRLAREDDHWLPSSAKLRMNGYKPPVHSYTCFLSCVGTAVPIIWWNEGTNILKLVAQNHLFADSFWLQIITTDSYVLAVVNIEWPDERHPKLIIYISELILDS